jgi:2-methylcitrate dehydratase PrpD
LIAACAASCEVTARVTAALVHAGVKPSNRFMPGQFLSYFGAAAGAGSILGLDAMKMASAFGLALMHAAGSRQVVLSGDPPSKAIYGAFPNQAGVQAALLAEAGLGAEVDVLGAPAGLYAMVYDNKSDAETLTGGLGRTYLCERVAFKPWPASGHVAPVAEAAGELAAKGIKPEQIASVELTVPADWKPWVEPLDGRRHPDNPAAAGNAIPFAVAKVLTNGAFVLGDMTPAGLADARAAAMADRVTYKLDETIKGGAVALTLLDGTKPVVHIDTPLGSPSRPLSDAQLVAKFRDCCSHAAEPISAASVDRLAQAILFLEQLDDIRTLTALMKA